MFKFDEAAGLNDGTVFAFARVQHRVEVLERVDQTVVVFVAQHFVVQHLGSNFVCEGYTIAVGISVLALVSELFETALVFAFDLVPVGALAADRNEVSVFDVWDAEVGPVELGAVLQSLCFASVLDLSS